MQDVATALVLMALFVLAGEVIARAWPFYRREVAPDPAARFESLDGFRGYLALGVFIHHAMATHLFLQTHGQTWDVVGRPWRMLGPVPVMLFFMITGFLFWLRAIKHRRMNPLELYRGRVLRIVPLYVVSAVAMLAIVLACTGMPKAGTYGAFAEGMAQLLAGGGVVRPTAINGMDPNDINASVLWTLHSEWKFYLLLPLIALVARPWGLGVLAGIYLGVHFFWPWGGPVAAQLHWHSIEHYFAKPLPVSAPALFLCGMTAAQLAFSFKPQRWAAGWTASVVCLVVIGVSCWFFESQDSLFLCVLLFGVIYSLVNGGKLVGLVSLPGARVLSKISYSIYLLHGIVLFLARPLLAPLVSAQGEPTVAYWAAVGGVGLVVVGVSAVTYRLVEDPFIRLEQYFKRRGKGVAKSVVAAPAVATLA